MNGQSQRRKRLISSSEGLRDSQRPSFQRRKESSGQQQSGIPVLDGMTARGLRGNDGDGVEDEISITVLRFGWNGSMPLINGNVHGIVFTSH
jgi:hypothetical protein